MTKRLSFLIDYKEYLAPNTNMKRVYNTRAIVNHDCYLPYKESLFKWGFYLKMVNVKQNDNRDLCQYDYYVFDKRGYIPQGIAMNQLFFETLSKKGWFSKIYENNLVLVLKNSQPGQDCVEDTKNGTE